MDMDKFIASEYVKGFSLEDIMEKTSYDKELILAVLKQEGVKLRPGKVLAPKAEPKTDVSSKP